MSVATRALVPMAFVASVEGSIAFYRGLGFEVHNTFQPSGSARLSWAWLRSGPANLMVSIASGPVDAGVQAVLFYLYVADVAATKAELESRGVATGALQYPFYAPKGEFRCIDPDGYVLMIMQAD